MLDFLALFSRETVSPCTALVLNFVYLAFWHLLDTSISQHCLHLTRTFISAIIHPSLVPV